MSLHSSHFHNDDDSYFDTKEEACHIANSRQQVNMALTRAKTQVRALQRDLDRLGDECYIVGKVCVRATTVGTSFIIMESASKDIVRRADLNHSRDKGWTVEIEDESLGAVTNEDVHLGCLGLGYTKEEAYELGKNWVGLGLYPIRASQKWPADMPKSPPSKTGSELLRVEQAQVDGYLSEMDKRLDKYMSEPKDWASFKVAVEGLTTQDAIEATYLLGFMGIEMNDFYVDRGWSRGIVVYNVYVAPKVYPLAKDIIGEDDPLPSVPTVAALKGWTPSSTRWEKTKEGLVRALGAASDLEGATIGHAMPRIDIAKLPPPNRAARKEARKKEKGLLASNLPGNIQTK